MLRALSLLAALAAPQAAQEFGPPATVRAEEPPPGVELYDSVQLLVNNDCITHSDLLRMTWQMGQSRKGSADMQELFRESITTLTRDLLLEQAGRDLGYEPEIIDATVRREMQAQRERVGSASALAEALDASRMDSSMLRDQNEGMVYRVLYRRAITGAGAGPGGRAYVDRYVRPGKMHLEFRRQGSRLDLPAIVHLQEIIIAPEVGEDLGGARQRAFLVRSRAQRGEDFAALGREFGVPTKPVGNTRVHDVNLDPIAEPQLASRPEVLEFVRGAQAGDVSEPLPATMASGQIGGWRLLRLVERVEGVAQRFEDREFQESLRQKLVEAREEYEVERALRRLMGAAYIWPPPPARRPPQVPGAEAAGPQDAAPEAAAPPEGEPEITLPPIEGDDEVEPAPFPEATGEPGAEAGETPPVEVPSPAAEETPPPTPEGDPVDGGGRR